MPVLGLDPRTGMMRRERKVARPTAYLSSPQVPAGQKFLLWLQTEFAYPGYGQEETALDAGKERFRHWSLSVQIIKRIVAMTPRVHTDGGYIDARIEVVD